MIVLINQVPMKLQLAKVDWFTTENGYTQPEAEHATFIKTIKGLTSPNVLPYTFHACMELLTVATRLDLVEVSVRRHKQQPRPCTNQSSWCIDVNTTMI